MKTETAKCCGSPYSCGAHDRARHRPECIWPAPPEQTIREKWIADGTMHDITFEAWSAELNKLSAADPHRYGGVDVIEECGAECWRDYYDNGYSPKGAWDEDGTYD